MNARIAALGPFGETVAAALTGIVERNLDVCEQHGMPIPKLSRKPEDADTRDAALRLYKECALYTLALLPIRPGKYTPVVITVGGLVGTGAAAGVARRRAEGKPAENQAQSTATADEPPPAPRAPHARTMRARPAAAAGQEGSVPFESWAPPKADAEEVAA